MPKIRLFILIGFLIALAVWVAVEHRRESRRAQGDMPWHSSKSSSPSGPRVEVVPLNEWMFTLDVRPSVAANQGLTNPATIWFCQEGRGGYALALWADRAELRKKEGASIHVLGEAQFSPSREGGELTIQRKVSGLCIVWGNRVLFRSPDAQFTSKAISIQAEASPFQVSLRRIQPLGEIYFTDDFMRSQSSGQWRPTSGNWHLCSLQIPERSANPFALFAKFAGSPKFNPLFTGRTRRYVGIGIRTERKANREQIVYVFEDAPAWRAGLRQDDEIQAVDGVPVSNMSGDELTRRVMGQAGTSVRLTVSRMVDGKEKEMTCVAEREPIDIDQIEDTVPLSPAPLSDSTSIFAGHEFWSDYTFAVSAKSLGEGEFGMVFYRRDDQNYLLFKWSATAGLSLVKVEDGRPRILAERSGEFAPDQYYRMEVSVLGTRIVARVDGIVVAEAKDDGLTWGEIGLYAAHSRGVYFDDVSVTSSDGVFAHRPAEPAGLNVAPRRHLPMRKNIAELRRPSFSSKEQTEAGETTSGAAPKQVTRLGDLFLTDAYMKAWASTDEDWLEGQSERGVQMRWNRFTFPGVFARLDVRRFYGDRLVLVLNAERKESWNGYALELSRFSQHGTLYRNGIAVQETERLSPYFRSASFSVSNGRLLASVDGKQALDHQDQTPLKGDTVGIGSYPVQMDFSNVSVSSSNVLDETFTTAPVNWRIAGGVWGVMNRWVCDPRWSWFGGRSKTLAAIWSKPAFPGDVSLDAFVAMEMPSYWKSPHERAADVGLTICGDGQNIATGYTVIFGADRNTRTKLFRGDRLVAETASPLFLFGNRDRGEEEGTELHRSWGHLTLQKRGDHVLFFVGNALGLEFEDPDPLPGGHVAMWTLDNGLLIARARVAYAEQQRPASLVLSEAKEYSDGHVTNARGDEMTSIVTSAGPKDTYTVTNARSGGIFALYLQQNPVNLEETPIVSFDYKMPTRVKLDLYFDYEGNRHRVLVTGPSSVRATQAPFQPAPRGARPLGGGPRVGTGQASPFPRDDSVAVTCGRFPDVKADDQWHHAEFRLLDALRDIYPYKPGAGETPSRRFVIENVALANYSNDGYLLAGLAGNRKGVSYLLRDFRFTSPQRQTGPQVGVASVEFPFQPPASAKATAGTEALAKAPSNTSQVVWRLDVPAGQMANFEALQAEVNGRRFAAGHPALEFRRLENIIALDLPRAGLVLKDGDVVSAALLHGDKRVSHESEWRFRLADDHSPPEDIRVSFGRNDFICDDFERDLGDCYPIGTEVRTMPWPAGGWLRREPRSPAGAGAHGNIGQYCLRVQNKRIAHDYGVGFLRGKNCDVGRYPILSFDYALPPGVSVDLSLALRNDSPSEDTNRKALQWASQTFRQDLRSYSSFPTIGVLCKPPQDNAWHHADINLFKKLKDYDSSRAEYVLHDVHIADDVCGYLGNYAGVSFWLDNIRLRPVLGLADLRPTWTASDISGISDYRCAFNADPNFTPTGKPRSNSSGRGEPNLRTTQEPRPTELERGKVSPADLSALHDGPTYFHLMLCDGAGNWSPPVHELVYLDVTPPEVAYFAPVWEIPGMFEIRFLEVGGLDPKSLVLKVGSNEYRVDGRRMWYDQETQKLTWRAGKDLAALLPLAKPLAMPLGRLGAVSKAEPPSDASQGNIVQVTLLAAKDFAGNAAQTPQTDVFPQGRQALMPACLGKNTWQWHVTTEPVTLPEIPPEILFPPIPSPPK